MVVKLGQDVDDAVEASEANGERFGDGSKCVGELGDHRE